MKIILNQNELAQNVKLLQRVLPKKNSNPLLTGVLLKTNSQKSLISLEANDLNWGLKINLVAQVEADQNYLLPGKTFFDATSIGDDDDTTLNFTAKNLLFQNGTDKVEFAVLEQENYPPFNFEQQKGIEINLSSKIISTIKDWVLYAASTDFTRPQLTGIYFNFLADKLEVVATDGFRLSIVDFAKPEKLDQELAFVVPAIAIPTLEAILDKNKVDNFQILVDQKNERVIFSAENFTFWVNMIKLAFPPYEKIIPPEFLYQIELDREDLIRTLQKATLFAKEASNTVQLLFSKQQLQVQTQSESGFYQSELELQTKIDQEIKIAFNIKYLLDYLNTLDQKNIFFGLNDAIKPVMFYLPKNQDYRYIVMPFKIRS